MVLNYILNEPLLNKNPEEMREIMNLLEKAVEIGYVKSVPLMVDNLGPTVISPNESYFDHLFSVTVKNTEEGEVTRIISATRTSVRLNVGKELYHIFFSK